MTSVRTLAWLGSAALAAALLTGALFQAARPTTRERWGVGQLRIHRTAGGHLLDLRYQVVDPERARTLLAEHSPAYLVHDKSGSRLLVPSTPKAGSLRNTGTPRAGRSYFALFMNPGGLVKRGDRVSLVLGPLATKLTVE